MEEKKKKIKINDTRPRDILIIIGITIVIIIVLIFVLKNIIKFNLSKDIFMQVDEKPKEIEWFDEEYVGIINIEDIIKENLSNQIKQVIEVQTAELEYQTEYQTNKNLTDGTIKVIQEGKDGEQELIIRKQYEGEKLVSDEQIGRRILKPAINKIIEIGTGSFYDIIYNNNNNIEYTKEELLNNLSKNMALNKPSGLTLEQFEKIFENEKKDKKGTFKENAKFFYYVEQVYGINGVFVAAVGIHESGWGTSKIAVNKKNLFGYGAYDMNAYASAYEYNGYAAGIDMIARVLMKNYLNPKGTIIYNGEVANGKYYNGNTVSGVNKKYATDTNWANSVYTWMKYLYNRL